MAKIRVGTKGWNGSEAARTWDECAIGIGVEWVEVDGIRLDDVVGVELKITEGFATPVLAVRMFGPMEIVYLDNEGVPLGTRETAGDAFAGHEVGHEFIMVED